MMSIEPLHRQGGLQTDANRSSRQIFWSALAWTCAYIPLVPGLVQAQSPVPGKAISRAALTADSARPVTGTLFISGGGRL